MKLSNEKAKRLERIAKLYYEQNRTQSEIAQIEGVSRPLVSRMLQEALDVGIVEIRICSLIKSESMLLNQVKNQFGLKGGILIQEDDKDNALNQSIAQATIDYIRTLGGGHVGLGWGHIIGTIVEILEQREPETDVITDVCPLVGNSGISIRNYHSNENVRIVANQTMSTPHYLHTPAFAETRQELDLIYQTEHYKAVFQEWEQLDIALVNIGNHPSSPDFASFARYGNLLAKRQAVGRMIAYYFNSHGEIIQSDNDYAIQIPLPILASCRNIVGVCSANVNSKSLTGALRTGLLSHIIAREELVREVLETQQI